MLAALFVLTAALGPAPALAASSVGPGTDDPPIRISLNNSGRYQRGDKAKVQIRTRDDGYLIVLHVDPDRRLRVLFPLDPRADNFVRGGQKFDITGRGGRESFRVDDGSGQGVVYAAISRDPYRFNDYQVGDHWDFRALSAMQIGDEVEADLNDFVRRIAASDFDYDLQRYEVYDRAYAGNTSYMTEVYGSGWGSSYGTNWYDGSCFGYWGCGWGGGTHLGIGVAFGRPWYARPFYDPWFYSPVGYYWPPPYYSPIYYDPYYPGYRAPYYRPRYPRGGAYGYDYYHGGYYTSPWRRRDPRVGSSTYAGGRGTFGGSYVPGRLGTGLRDDGGWRNRGVATTPVGTNGSTYAAPRRAGEPRPVDMTPTRGEGRRPGPEVIVVPTGRRPEARPADGRSEPRPDASPGRRDLNDLPRRVGPVGDPRRLNDDRSNAPRIVPPSDRANPNAASEPRGRREVDGIEMPRVIEPRSPERRSVEARGPEPRPAEPRAVEPRAVEPRATRPPDVRAPEPRPAERPAPREMTGGDRGRAPEARPNVEPARREAPREAPPARVERAAPRERGGDGGSRRPSPRQ